MRKYLLLAVLCLIATNVTFSQSIDYLSLDDKMTTKVDFEGTFTYSVNNVNYIIDLSISNWSYTERSESGTILSSGTFERKGDITYRLTPTEIFTEARIKEVINFKTISRTSKDANIEIYKDYYESGGTLLITKVQ